MSIDCLVINLTRFGDLIQSQPLFHELHAHGFRTGLVCQENFAQALPLLADVDESFVLKGARALRNLDRDWKQACVELMEWAHDVRTHGKLRVLNLTATLPARLLARLLSDPDKNILGFGLDAEGFGVNSGPWATFLSGTSLCRENAVFNISDMFRLMAEPLYTDSLSTSHNALDQGLNEPGTEEKNMARTLLGDVERLPYGQCVQGFLAFQLGASSPKRQWPTHYFALLGDLLWKHLGLCPVLTGAGSEETLAGQYMKRSTGPFVNAIGKTSLPVLSALLTEMRLLVSNDTGTLHLASALKTPSLSFFLSTAQPWDTGPTLSHCLSLEPDLDCHPCPFNSPCPNGLRCLAEITPEPVFKILKARLCGASWQEGVRAAGDLHARAWESGRTDDGFATVRALSSHKNADRTLWIRHQRLFWRYFFDALCSVKRNAPPPSVPPCSEIWTQGITPVLSQVLTLLKALSEEGELLAKNSKAGPLFLRNCDRLQTILSTCSPLTGMAHFWRELRGDCGQDLERLIQTIRLLLIHLDRLRSALTHGTDYAY
ncbi:MAG: glycosyltransferase family 9 protein [Desulfovibrio sp.]|nr:glycosyltransferase family 9 protein [Desulfovibrio sp.]